MPNPPISLSERYAQTGRDFSGAQGQVFVCADTFLGREVAIKFIKTDDPETLNNEVRALSAIRSNHVVRLYELVRANDADYAGLVLEYLSGDDLTAFQSADPLVILKLLYQIASGIADIHAAGLIHRDVKPKNIKRDAGGIVKLFDFGLSCAIDDAETTAVRGTRAYRAPEYYETAPIDLTQKVDCYSFGVTAWWLMASSLPWELRDTPPRQPPSFATHVVQLPEDVIELLDATLERDPEARPDMAAVRDVLKRHLLHGQHRARVSDRVNTLEIGQAGQTARVSLGTTAEARITYNGLDFVLSAVTGDVYVNGVPAQANGILPHSCVLILGGSALGAGRKFVTFDVSHPEVIL